MVKLSLKLWSTLLTIATLVSLCIKVSVEIETSLRVILQIHHIVLKALPCVTFWLVENEALLQLSCSAFDLIRLPLQPAAKKKHESGSDRLCGAN